MDIIDIILARAKSFTGETATLVQQAQAAMADANDIVDRLEAIQADTEEANETATAAAEAATTAAASFDEMKEDIEAAAAAIVGDQVSEALGTTVSDVADLQTRTTALEGQIANAGGTVSVSDAGTSTAKIKQLSVTKNGQTTTYQVEKNYTSYGDNEDGSMTQKAIKQYVESQVAQGAGNSGGTSNLGSENAGSVVIVDADGSITAGDTSEQAIIEALIRTGVYHAKNAVGLGLDYENKTIDRTQESTSTTNFNSYSMYGGRKRCNVNDNGTITAFYEDSNYKEDGSNGQVMVYQPKFYYQRVVINSVNGELGQIVRKESLIISPTAQSGFKLHPAFIDADGNEIEYILLSAYEGSAYDVSTNTYITDDAGSVDFAADKLSSIAGVKPISGENNILTAASAEQLARNRGEGWHILNMKAYSVDQMLSMVEYGSLNIQEAIESGVSGLVNSYDHNRACNTGSTAALGNASGAATSSSNNVNGTVSNYGEAGKRSISYRGEENPYGNIWKFIGDVNVSGDGTEQGGLPYICKNYNYSTSITSDYESIGFYLPNASDWISGMGYGDEKYDWVIMPAEAANANSATPVGDYVWVTSNLNDVHPMAIGGNWLFGQRNGMFYQAFDRTLNYSAPTFGARLILVPTKNTIHDNNYALWQSKLGG